MGRCPGLRETSVQKRVHCAAHPRHDHVLLPPPQALAAPAAPTGGGDLGWGVRGEGQAAG